MIEAEKKLRPRPGTKYLLMYEGSTITRSDFCCAFFIYETNELIQNLLRLKIKFQQVLIAV